LKAKTKVVDVSGAFRLKDAESYLQWYGFEHKHPDLLATAQYGLSPFLAETAGPNTERPTPALIANPGCYATAVQMALIPLLKLNLLQTETIVIDAKSGTTGAGKKAAESQLFAEVESECLPYKIGKHQHFPEICEHIENFTTSKVNPIFSTTLIPVRRGIIAGIYAQLQTGVTLADIEKAYQKAYANYPLVRFGPAHQAEGAPLLSLKKVVGSARTHLAYSVDGSKLYLYSSIDNLMKGAATQAIENMNYLWGWPAQTGLLHREGLL
jgi:N-acetyl-gamma-glutamyl-phosphate reductase